MININKKNFCFNFFIFLVLNFLIFSMIRGAAMFEDLLDEGNIYDNDTGNIDDNFVISETYPENHTFTTLFDDSYQFEESKDDNIVIPNSNNSIPISNEPNFPLDMEDNYFPFGGADNNDPSLREINQF